MGFEWAYRTGNPPWDIGRPQPAVVRLAEQGAFGGRVLDVGCGTGENSLYLASRGLEVVGVDAAPTAVERARLKSAERGIAVRFELADALALDDGGRAFDAALDCGLFHTFGDTERLRFERSLSRVLAPGAVYHLLCFSDLEPDGWGPRRVTQGEIRATFAAGWRIDSIVEERFATRWDGDGPLAWLASLTFVGRDPGER
jgi:SAM-dependent methyltransferase